MLLFPGQYILCRDLAGALERQGGTFIIRSEGRSNAVVSAWSFVMLCGLINSPHQLATI